MLAQTDHPGTNDDRRPNNDNRSDDDNHDRHDHDDAGPDDNDDDTDEVKEARLERLLDDVAAATHGLDSEDPLCELASRFVAAVEVPGGAAGTEARERKLETSAAAPR